MKKPNTIKASELVILRRRWRDTARALHSTRNWTYNDAQYREARANKAKGIESCVADLDYLLKHGRA